MKKMVNFPKQYKTVMALMPASGRVDYKRAMIAAIIASEKKPAVRIKKGVDNDTDL